MKYGEGQCVFPVEGNMYGEAGAGQGFIVVFQNALIRCGWTRAKEDPSFFFRLCPKSKKLQGISSYVDDLAGAISSKDPKKIWDELRARGWIFENEKELTKFLGVVIKKNSPRRRRRHANVAPDHDHEKTTRLGRAMLLRKVDNS